MLLRMLERLLCLYTAKRNSHMPFNVLVMEVFMRITCLQMPRLIMIKKLTNSILKTLDILHL